MKHNVGLVAMAVVVLLSFPSPAAAYLDPVTGSMAIQMVMGGILTAAAATKIYWRRIRELLGHKGSEQVDKDLAGPARD